MISRTHLSPFTQLKNFLALKSVFFHLLLVGMKHDSFPSDRELKERIELGNKSLSNVESTLGNELAQQYIYSKINK